MEKKMANLKSAYELANERIIAPKEKKRDDSEERPFDDFIEIPEFSNREEKMIEERQTQYIQAGQIEQIVQSDQIEQTEQIEQIESVRVQPSEKITFSDNYDDPIEVHWNGHFLDYGGFSRMNRAMAFGLSNKGVSVKLEIEPNILNHVNKSTQKQIELMTKTKIAPDAPKVYGVTVPSLLSHAGKKILYTMIETSETIHKDYVGKLNMVDEIWVPTQYGKKILQKNNVHPPIYVMPLGVDTERYCPDAKPFDFGMSLKGFVFISVFRWSYRKGFDIMLRSFMEEFDGTEDVTFLMVSRAVECPEEIGSNKIISDFNDIKSFINKDGALPHVALYNKPIPERSMPGIYTAADAFILISRGEGFGLPFLEASSCGLPVIGSYCSGQTDFLNDDNSYLVHPKNYVEAKINSNLSRMAKLCHFYEGQMFPDFDSDSIKQTRFKMREVYENYSEAKRKNELLKNLISDNYTWDGAVSNVFNRLKNIRRK